MIDTKFWLSFLTLVGLFSTTQVAQAQTYQPSNRAPVSDNTLGTQVSGAGGNFDITGGVSKGQTLFHSFTDFSVPTSGQANFINSVGNRDIITRVTGNLFSDINGTVNTNGANLFLINPSGIVFGPNAQLNVGKAFVGSTANSIDLVGGGRTITFGTNPNGDAPLLSVAPNVLFDVSRLNLGGGTGAISNFGTLQTQNKSQYIGLIGGNVTLDGSAGGGKIIAPGGRVDIGGLSGAGSVSIDNQGLVFSSTGIGRSNVLLTNDAGIIVRATGTLDTVSTFFNNATSNGSNINISANNLDVLNSGAKLSDKPAALDAGLEVNSGKQTKPAGDIKIDATGKISLNNSDIKNTLRSGSEGNVGDIKIQAHVLDVDNKSFISTVTAGKGNAGNLTLIAKDAVLLSGNSSIDSSVLIEGVGKGGSIDINAGSLSMTGGAKLIASTFGQGNTGNVTVTAKDAVSLVNANIFSAVEAGGVGKGGNIDINASSLSLKDGAQLLTITRGASATQPAGRGEAGSTNVKVSGAIDIAGFSTVYSGIRSQTGTGTVGNGGNITIDSGSLSLRDGAEIVASTYGTGNAGNITVTAKDAVSLTQNSSVISSVETGGIGNGGNIAINAGSLSIQDSADLTTVASGTGNAGNVNVKVSGAVDIAGSKDGFFNGIFSYVGTGVKGNGGDITIDAGAFSLRDGARLRASTYGTGNAGNVTVKVKNAAALVGDSLILSTVESGGVGKGGSIDITAGSLSLKDGAQLLSVIREASTTQPAGRGDAGNVTVKVSDAIDIAGSKDKPFSGIFSYVDTGVKGNGGDITIDAGAFSLRDGARLRASTYGTGNAGNVTVKVKNAAALVGDSLILSTVESGGVGKGGTIDINAGSLSLKDGAQLLTSTREASSTQPAGRGDAGNVNVKVSGAVDIAGSKNGFSSAIFSDVDMGTKGNGGNITVDSGSFSLQDGARLRASNFGQGSAGNILLNSGKVLLNKGNIFSTSFSTTGGNITIKNSDYLILRNKSSITTDSYSTAKNGNGGNITIDSPVIVATPGNNDISADATQGTGGRVNIVSQGLFGIQYRPKGQESAFTNDITASSTFGRDGAVNISTPGTDPGKDSTELPKTTTDASNQISQVCGANSRQNKLTVTGRGGLPPTANDPLTSDVVWQDARAASPQPVASNVKTNPAKLAAPAVGLVFDGKGKVTLVAAGTQGQPTGTSVVCPQTK